MSRIGKKPVAIPSGVTAEIGEGTLSVKRSEEHTSELQSH